MTDSVETPYECVDPTVGETLWRLEDPAIDGATRNDLEAHLAICHACNLLVHVDGATRRLAAGGALNGRLRRQDAPTRLRPRTRLAGAAATALAACIVFSLSTPPQPVSPVRATRGPAEPRFLRPVEGEVLSTPEPWIEWTPIDGANGYFIELRDDEGIAVWEGESDQTELQLPHTVRLEHGRSYRAILSARPGDLLPPGAISVLFQSDSRWREYLHHMRWAHPLVRGTASIAFLILLLSLIPVRREQARP